MYKLVVVGTVASSAYAHYYHPVNREIVDEIKQKATSWIPAEPEENPLFYMPEAVVKGLMGTIIPTSDMEFPDPEPLHMNEQLPQNFDSREKWGDCVHPIRDQQQCGSCWAFGSSEALSDRFCIASGGKVDKVLSPEDLVECDSSDMGCNGGYLNHAWRYLESTGIVTNNCLPYTSGSGKVTSCPNTCSTDVVPYQKYKCQQGTVVAARTESKIKEQLYNYGPMETGFTVYSDFMNYKSGVYVHHSGYVEGGHAVKMVGWGYDDASGLDYWICANSWGTGWGEEGFFRIAFGQCGIDQTVYGCTPDVDTALTYENFTSMDETTVIQEELEPEQKEEAQVIEEDQVEEEDTVFKFQVNFDRLMNKVQNMFNQY